MTFKNKGFENYTYKYSKEDDIHVLYKDNEEIYTIKLKNCLCNGINTLIKINDDIYWILGTYANPLHIINLSNKKVIIDESFGYNDFIWCAVKVIYKNYIVVNGCMWAYPYENIVYKINEHSIEKIDFENFKDVEYEENCYEFYYNPFKKVSDFDNIDDFIDEKNTEYFYYGDIGYQVEKDYLNFYGYISNQKHKLGKLKLEYLI